MKTFDECLQKSQELDIPVELITKAFGVEIPLNDTEISLQQTLSENLSQDEIIEVFNRTPDDSPVKEEALRLYLKGSKTQEERWDVFHNAQPESKIKYLTLKELHKNATSLVELLGIYKDVPEGSPLELLVIRSMCSI